jgi:hypothetical protein
MTDKDKLLASNYTNDTEESRKESVAEVSSL